MVVVVVVVMMVMMMVILDEFHLCGRAYLRPRRIFGFQYCKRIRNGFQQVPIAGAGRDRQLRLLGWRGLRSGHGPNGCCA
jgi:hypothetical protein